MRMPKGDHVSMGAYDYMFDKATEKVKNLRRCVDEPHICQNTGGNFPLSSRISHSAWHSAKSRQVSDWQE